MRFIISIHEIETKALYVCVYPCVHMCVCVCVCVCVYFFLIDEM